jgi:HlyD family secretion protein
MSTPTTDVIAAPAERKSPPPKPHRPTPGPSKGLYPWAIAAVALLAGVTILFAFISRAPTPESGAGAIRTATAEQGNFVNTLRLSGTTEAVTSYPIVAPRLAGEPGWQMTIVRLRSNGAHLKRGDLLVEFDRQNEIENYLDHRAHFMDLSRQVAKQQKTDTAARAKDETDIQTAADQVKTAQLEMQRLELLSRIDQEITREQLAEAQASLKELQQTFKLKRAEAAAGLRDLELQRDQARRDMLHSLHNEERMAIHSPIDGVVVLHSIWKGGRFGLVEEGDQVRPGLAFMDVVNPSRMEVSAKVNQMDAARLRAGQQAEVRLEAYSGLALPARLETVGPIAAQGQFSDRVRDFTAQFSVKEGDPRLMPDLTAAVDVELGRRENALMVPNDCVVRENGRAYVFAERGGSFRKQEVKLGPQNSLMTVIESGLKAGAVVKRGVDQG